MKKKLEEMLKRMHSEESRGGFTLVELIVVMIILGILAALLIPSLTGYIDKAKTKGAVAEARSVLVALQTCADEDYADGSDVLDENWWKNNTSGGYTAHHAEVAELAEVTIAETTVAKVTFDSTNKTQIKTFTYDNGKYQVEFDRTAAEPFNATKK